MFSTLAGKGLIRVQICNGKQLMTFSIENDRVQMKQGYDIRQLFMVRVYRGGSVVKVLCYKSEGRFFDPRWCHWNFS